MTTPRRVITKKLGELLVERKVITPEQLTQTLQVQQDKGGLLGQILVTMGFASEEAVAQALTSQYGFPFLPLKHYSIETELVRLIPENVARQYCLVPVDRIGDTLTVAMADPLNAHAVEDLEMLSRCSVQVFVSTLSDVAEAIQRHYGAANGG
jgi:type IV pilus assembly protein PilB